MSRYATGSLSCDPMIAEKHRYSGYSNEMAERCMLPHILASSRNARIPSIGNRPQRRTHRSSPAHSLNYHSGCCVSVPAREDYAATRC